MSDEQNNLENKWNTPETYDFDEIYKKYKDDLNFNKILKKIIKLNEENLNKLEKFPNYNSYFDIKYLILYLYKNNFIKLIEREEKYLLNILAHFNNIKNLIIRTTFDKVTSRIGRFESDVQMLLIEKYIHTNNELLLEDFESYLKKWNKKDQKNKTSIDRLNFFIEENNKKIDKNINFTQNEKDTKKDEFNEIEQMLKSSIELRNFLAHPYEKSFLQILELKKSNIKKRAKKEKAKNNVLEEYKYINSFSYNFEEIDEIFKSNIINTFDQFKRWNEVNWDKDFELFFKKILVDFYIWEYYEKWLKSEEKTLQNRSVFI